MRPQKAHGYPTGITSRDGLDAAIARVLAGVSDSDHPRPAQRAEPSAVADGTVADAAQHRDIQPLILDAQPYRNDLDVTGHPVMVTRG